jgi:hypothetical protein
MRTRVASEIALSNGQNLVATVTFQTTIAKPELFQVKTARRITHSAGHFPSLEMSAGSGAMEDQLPSCTDRARAGTSNS